MGVSCAICAQGPLQFFQENAGLFPVARGQFPSLSRSSTGCHQHLALKEVFVRCGTASKKIFLEKREASAAGGNLSGYCRKLVKTVLAKTKALKEANDGVTGLETEAYVMREGEWVTEVANRLGILLQDLQALNPTVNLDKVFAGQVIQIPKQSSVAEKMRSREELSLERLTSEPSFPAIDGPNFGSLLGLVSNSSTYLSNFALASNGELNEGEKDESVGSRRDIREDASHEGANLRSSSGGIPRQPSNQNDSREEAHKELEYMVQPGDYLADIASRHGVKLKSLIALNKLKYEDRIRVGQILLIPPDEPSHLEELQVSQQSPFSMFFREISSDPFFQAATILSAIIVAGGMMLVNSRQQSPKIRKLRGLVPNEASDLEGETGIQRPFPSPSPRFGFLFGRQQYTRQLEDIAKSIAATFGRTFESSEGTKVGEGFAFGKSQQEALEMAFRVASSSLKGSSPCIALLSLSCWPPSKLAADSRATASASLLARLIPAQSPPMLGVMTLGGGGFLSLADLQGKEKSFGDWAAVLLVATSEGSIHATAAEAGAQGFQGAIQDAAEALKLKLGSARLKSVVANVSGNSGRTVLDKLSSTFPRVSCYEVSATGAKLAGASDWQLHTGESSKTSQMRASQGVILLGVTADADFSGAFFATVMGQWLYGKHVHVAARPPKSTYKDSQ